MSCPGIRPDKAIILLLCAKEAYVQSLPPWDPRQRRQRDKAALPPHGLGSIEMSTGPFVRHVTDTRPFLAPAAHILLAPTVMIPLAIAIAIVASGFYLRSGISIVGL